MKKFILDTSVLIHDPKSLYAFEDNMVIIISEVLAELNKKKSESGHAGKKARDVIRELESLILERGLENVEFDEKLSFPNPREVENGLVPDEPTIISVKERVIKLDEGYIKIEGIEQLLNDRFTISGIHTEEKHDMFSDLLNSNEQEIVTPPETTIKRIPNNSSLEGFDDGDIGILKKAIFNYDDAILVTKDKMLRILTKVNYLDVEDYKKDRVEEQYDGVEDDIHAPSSFIDGLFNEGVMEFDYGDSLYENQFTIVKNQNQSALGQYRDNKVELIKEQTVHSITTSNKEQHFAMKALMDKSIDMVTITGVAGTGKTLLALAAGLEQVLETKDYNRILVARPTVTNNDLGYLPGDKEEKLRPWMQPIYDNIDFIYDQRESEEVVEDFKTIDKLKVEALAYIRGRSIPKQFFIIDEAQNLTPDKVKTIVSRAGEDRKSVV